MIRLVDLLMNRCADFVTGVSTLGIMVGLDGAGGAPTPFGSSGRADWNLQFRTSDSWDL